MKSFLLLSSILSSFKTSRAKPLNQQVDLLNPVACGKLDSGYVKIFQAVGLAAGGTLEMDVVVVVIVLTASLAAEGVAGTFVVEHLVNNSLFQERFQRTVNRHAVEALTQGTFQISVRKRHVAAQESFQYLFAARSSAEFVIFEGGANELFHKL